MTDVDLLILGCGVTFIAMGGSYVYLRERYLERERAARGEPACVGSPGENDRRVA